jgi:hypothetical protein
VEIRDVVWEAYLKSGVGRFGRLRLSGALAGTAGGTAVAPRLLNCKKMRAQSAFRILIFDS